MRKKGDRLEKERREWERKAIDQKRNESEYGDNKKRKKGMKEGRTKEEDNRMDGI